MKIEEKGRVQIVVLGDSVAQGLGVAGRCYGDLVAAQIARANRSPCLANWAASAAQISYTQGILPKVIDRRPDLVLISHGITEAVVRPSPTALRRVPPRWRQIGWMDPRPYYSRRLGKRLYQKAESALRWRVKVWLIRRAGGHSLTSVEEFQRRLSATLETLLQETHAQIVLITHNGIDERFYPHSLSSLCRYQRAAVQAAAEAGQPERIHICDVSLRLHRWSDFLADHFHPNAAGHAKIADAIEVILNSSVLEAA